MRTTIALCTILLAALPARAQMVLPLEVADGGYLYVRARVAGDVDVRLLLDTGAGINTLSESVLARLGARAREAGTHTGTRHDGERITGTIWSVPSMAIGGFAKRDVVVGAFAPRNADGLLSMDFFRDQPFTLDLKAGTLTIETPGSVARIAARATAIPVRLAPNGPNELGLFVRVCAGDGVAAEAEFDTGAGFNMLMLQPSYMERLGIHPPAGERGPLEYYVQSTFLPELHYCEAPTVRTTRQFVGFKAGLIYEGLVGHGAFRDRRLTIDLPGRRMLAW